jgi:hypothetical protein
VCDGTLVPANSEIVEVVQSLYARRNNLVHPKAREPKYSPKAATDEERAMGLATSLIEGMQKVRPEREDAKASVAEMRRFFELFEEYDPEVKRVREADEKWEREHPD